MLVFKQLFTFLKHAVPMARELVEWSYLVEREEVSSLGRYGTTLPLDCSHEFPHVCMYTHPNLIQTSPEMQSHLCLLKRLGI